MARVQRWVVVALVSGTVLASVPAPLSAAPESAAWTIEDGSSDTQGSPVGAEDVDVRTFAIADEDDGVFLAQWRMVRAASGGADGDYDLILEVSFLVAGQDRFAVIATASGQRDVPGGPFKVHEVNGRVRVWTGEYPEPEGVPVEARLDTATATFTVVVPKDSFVREDGSRVNLTKGMELSDFRGGARRLEHWDDFDEGVRTYKLRTHAANDVVQFRSPHTTLPLAPGANATYEFDVANRGDAKRVVRLNYTLPDGSGFAAGGPALLTLPARSERTVAFWLRAPDVGGATILQVRGTSVGIPDETALLRRAALTWPALDPEHRRAFIHFVLHDQLPASFYNPAWCTFTNCGQAFLSMRQTHPRAMEGDRDQAAYNQGSGDVGIGGGLEGSTPVPVQFAANGTWAMRLALATDLPRSGLAEATLTFRTPAGTSGVVARAQKPFEAPGGEFDFDLGGPLAPDAKRPLPRDSRLLFWVGFTFDSETPDLGGPLWVQGGASWLDLPLAPPPPEIPATVGAFQVRVQGEAAEFVAADATHPFRIAVLNQAPIAHTAHFTLNASTPGWSPLFDPAPQLRLEPGAFVVVGLLAKPPAGAKEGDRANFLVHVEDDDGVRHALPLSLIVVTGAFLEDQSVGYESDPEAKARAATGAPSQTPAPAWMSVALVLGAIALARRRA